jgi:transcriptional regulator with XRE-family HTH domain
MGAAVRGAFAQANITQAEAAGPVGISLQSLSRRVNGLLPFTWTELVRIAELTGVSVSDLVASAERISGRSGSAA